MVNQKLRPDQDALEHAQRRGVGPTAIVFVLAAALVIGAVALWVITSGDDADPGSASTTDDPSPTSITGDASPASIPVLPDGGVEAGRYVFATWFGVPPDPSYRITMDVPEGYLGFEGVAVIRSATDQTAVSALEIGDVYGDPCHWHRSALDRSEIATPSDVAAALANQEGLIVSDPTEIAVGGLTATYMERRVARADLSDCDEGQFRVYLDPRGGARWLEQPGQTDLLWIVDVGGVPVVIDVSLDPGTSAEVRHELVRMVRSVQIDLHEEA